MVAASIRPSSRRSASIAPRDPRREVLPVEEHRLVLGEGVAVVGQDDEVVLGDLGIGGVEIGGVDLAGGERAVGHLVLDAAHAGRGQAVAVAQRRPPVGTLHELVREGEADAGARARSERVRIPSRSAAARLMPTAYVSSNPSGAVMPTPAPASPARRAASSAAAAPPRSSRAMVPVYSG